MKQLYLLILISFSVANLSAQYARHIIELTDKGGTIHTIANPSAYLSAKSIARRTAHNIAIDSTDLPLSKPYLDSIAAVPNVVIYNKSKWLNQVLIRTNDPAALTKIRSFSFVKKTLQIGNYSSTRQPSEKFNENVTPIDKPAMFGTKTTSGTNDVQALNYGNSFRQINIHEGDFLHNRGYTGRGVEMAVMDAGFRLYKTNPAFDSVRLQNRILGTWDYVANEESVNEDHNHGADCFSIIAANRPGAIVGSAPHASFWLFRTEDVFSEMPVEEQNWIAAAEFADSAGVQMFSTSLGYLDFDDPTLNYDYARRDGNTAMITRAADLAARKGILVMNSAGNYGNRVTDDRFVLVPADGDSVVAVGAVDVNGVIAYFSSRGPNAAGKIKPNIVSVGMGTVFAPGHGNPAVGQGTSFSNPNMAGLIACLWQAFPEKSNMQIIGAVERSADRYHAPDAAYGYGIPNLRKAYQELMAISFNATTENKLDSAVLSWTMKDDSSVSYIIERKLPGTTEFEKTDSIRVQRSGLDFSDYDRSFSQRLTINGSYEYRIHVRIGSDTSFYSTTFRSANQWPTIVADSLRLNTSFKDCATSISWSMPENSSVEYRLERQLPGTNSFANIITVKATGTNFETRNYVYTDPIATPLPGQIQYRLRVALGSDTVFYSQPSSFINLNPCYSREGFFFTPSPFRNEVLAMMNTTEGASKLNVAIYDVAGRLLQRYHGSKPAGYHHVRIPVAHLSSGIYIGVIYLDNKLVYKQRLTK